MHVRLPLRPNGIIIATATRREAFRQLKNSVTTDRYCAIMKVFGEGQDEKPARRLTVWSTLRKVQNLHFIVCLRYKRRLCFFSSSRFVGGSDEHGTESKGTEVSVVCSQDMSLQLLCLIRDETPWRLSATIPY